MPADAPKPRSFAHTPLGEPTHRHEYRDAEGQLMGYVCRFLRSAGGVHKLTLTWCRNEDDKSCAWRWIQFRKLRPLYRAADLDNYVGEDGGTAGRRMVMVLADELAADEMLTRRMVYAAEAVKNRGAPAPFLSYDFVSWPGGRSKLGEVDWSPLRGRVVAIWFPHSAQRFKVGKDDLQAGELLPIEKQPWRVAALALQETLRSFGAIPISIAETKTTEELPDGWDPVQALHSGWDFIKLEEWYRAHFATEQDVEEARRLASGSPAAPRPSATEPPWMRELLRKDGVGPLLPELRNVRKILTHHERWRGVIYLDDFAHSVMKAKPPPFDGSEPGEWRDYDDSMSADWMAGECGILKLKTSVVAEAVQMVARQAAKNPLVDYLKGLKWDKTPRLDSWLKDLLKAGPFDDPNLTEADAKRLEEYLRIIGRKWLLGAVARATRPGCKFDYVLILEGQQGLGKSTAFSILGGEWTMDTPFSLSDKEGMETIRGMWIVEIAELDSFNKADSTLAKSFFSRTKDRFRLPYAKRSTTFRRTSVFGATTNENEYFRDPTGNRRYWPVHCDRKGYDKDQLVAVRDQLLAEAMAVLGDGEQIWPSAAEEKVIREQQRRREIPDPWVGRIARWLQTPEAKQAEAGGELTREKLLAEAVKVEVSRMDERGMATRVGKAMHKLGYEKEEDKTLPERFRYVKRQSGEEGDDE